MAQEATPDLLSVLNATLSSLYANAYAADEAPHRHAPTLHEVDGGHPARSAHSGVTAGSVEDGDDGDVAFLYGCDTPTDVLASTESAPRLSATLLSPSPSDVGPQSLAPTRAVNAAAPSSPPRTPHARSRAESLDAAPAIAATHTPETAAVSPNRAPDGPAPPAADEEVPRPEIEPAAPPVAEPTAAASAPSTDMASQCFAALDWLLPLISGWKLEAVSVETHKLHAPASATRRPPARRGRQPQKGRWAKKNARPVSKAGNDRSDHEGAAQTMFHVVLHHTRHTEKHLELLLPSTMETGADGDVSVTVNLADPALTVYDITNARQFSVAEATTMLLTESLREAQAQHAHAIAPASDPPAAADAPTRAASSAKKARGTVKRERSPSPPKPPTRPARSDEASTPQAEEAKKHKVELPVDVTTTTAVAAAVAQTPEKRGRERSVRHSEIESPTSTVGVADGSEGGNDSQPRRGRGRPRRVLTPDEKVEAERRAQNPRPRGRPRKAVKEEESRATDDHADPATPDEGVPVKREAAVAVGEASAGQVPPVLPYTSLLEMEEALSASLKDSAESPVASGDERAGCENRGGETKDMRSLLEIFTAQPAASFASSARPHTGASGATPAEETVPPRADDTMEVPKVRVTMTPPRTPQTPGDVVFRGHRLPDRGTSPRAIFSVEAWTSPHATLRMPRRRSTSPARQRSASRRPPLSPQTRAAASTSREFTVAYLAALRALRRTHAAALREQEAWRHSQPSTSASAPRHPDTAAQATTGQWGHWASVTQQRAASQGARQWMREGLEVSVPSPRLRGDALAAGIHALDVADCEDHAYTGHTACAVPLAATTTTVDGSPSHPQRQSTEAVDARITTVRLPALWAGSLSVGDDAGDCPVPNHLHCLAGSLNALGGDTMHEGESLTGFPRSPPPEFLPVSGFALLQVQERITTALASPLFATDAEHGAHARCVVYTDGIPPAPAMPITNTFRTHSTLRVVPSGLPALAPPSGETDETSHVVGGEVRPDQRGDAEARPCFQHVVVPNPLQDTVYYVHRRLLPHRLREEADRDGVLAITADGVYPDTETVKSLKLAQLNALMEKAASVPSEESAQALQYVAVADLELPADEAVVPPSTSPPSVAPKTTTSATSAPTESCPEPPPADVLGDVDGLLAVDPAVRRGPVGDSEAVGDQVDRLLRRGHDIKRVPMPSIEWFYGPV